LNLFFEPILTGRDLNQNENKVDLNLGASKNRVKADLFLHIFIFGLGSCTDTSRRLLLAANLQLFTKDEMVQSTKKCTDHQPELAIHIETVEDMPAPLVHATKHACERPGAYIQVVRYEIQVTM
jgi:hypothetical protein